MKTIDPRTTRRTMTKVAYDRNSALYAIYRVIGHQTDPYTQEVSHVILEKKTEFCVSRKK
jgi:hypothetical protein